MVHHKVFILLRQVQIAVMAGRIGDHVIRVQNLLLLPEGAEGRIRNAVIYMVVALIPLSGGPEEEIPAIPLYHTWTFHIILRGDLQPELPVGKGQKAVHGFIHNHSNTMSPAAVIQVDRSVIVLKQMRVDGLCIVVNIPKQGMSQITLERTCRRIRDRNLQTARLVVAVDIVGRKYEVILAVSRNDRRCPNRTPNPRKIRHIDDIFMAFPIHHVLGRKRRQILLLRKCCRVGHIDPVSSLIESCLRICIMPLYDGVISFNCLHHSPLLIVR